MSRFVLLYYAFFSPKLQTWMPKRSKTCILCSGKPHLQFLILENMPNDTNSQEWANFSLLQSQANLFS